MSSGLSSLYCYRPRHNSDDEPEAMVEGKGWLGSSSTRAGKQPENVWPPYPPPDESELERAVRLEEEREAKLRSDAIDRALEAERQTLRRERKLETKLLLLGQSESGKSTMLKNFQIHFAPNALRAESDAWRAVIHLNLIRSVNFLLDILTRPPSNNYTGDSSPTASSFSNRISATPQPNSDLRRFKLTLSPLRQVEMILAKYLSARDAPNADSGRAASPTGSFQATAADVTIRGGHSWRALCQPRREGDDEEHSRHSDGRVDPVENARQILDACRADVVLMWTSASMQAALRDEGVSRDDVCAFFLDEADRIMQKDYEPTFDDILRARLQTDGVEEHHLTMETGAENGQHWIFYDVGGARGQRASWVPFFEDVNAIIFLCSTAGFNEVLAEDHTVNRLLDSFTTWKTICSSKLLVSVQFILILNKMDLLDARLKAGIQFSHYVKSYKEENDLEHVTEYLKRKFSAIHRHHSPEPRKLHMHSTCAIDMDTTSAVLLRIRDTLLVTYLAAMELI
ncbi:G-alpha-domain-containing protein [Cubamyces lactineus]|nr:G-alpha-domain-containing protein [Cubamyces lactineus]